ncbi:MAG TPA: S8 family serine peptidase [Kiritimatiellia bacterium]|nr:S8 family serine peptidase [Kiritimatiellia bacterium]HMO52469.1 S8 family serine peptidase [Kiritimatiellia bacterium]
MMPTTLHLRTRLAAAFMVLNLGWLPAWALPRGDHELKIDGEVVTLRANRAPLRDILADFVRAGIAVRADPDIDSRVSGSVRQMPIDRALEEILSPYGYALIWSVVPGPLGDLERLEEIQVFRRDGPRQLEPFQPETNFRITRGPLPGSPEFVADEILITVAPGTDINAFRAWLSQIGGSVIGSVPELGIYRIRLPPNTNVLALIDQLAGNPIISRAEPNYAYRLPNGQPETVAASGGERSGASRATEGVPPVAVLDSGLRALSELDGLVVGRFDAIQPERRLDDRAGHGTQMALIASGAIPPGGVAGDNVGVPIVAIRAFDDNGYTSSYTMMRAIQQAATEGARVVNMSWGTETPSAFLESAMRQAQARGLLVVASAGNEPNGRPVYPAAYPGVISVSALQSDGTPWPRSNHGDTVTVAAPGTARFPIGHEGPPGSYAGTSIASAYVSRTLALYLAQNPKADARRARQALLSAASPPPTGAVRYGSGSVDDAAMNRLLRQP